MPGLVAPATAIVQPSQLIPASQYTWMFLSGPSGSRSGFALGLRRLGRAAVSP